MPYYKCGKCHHEWEDTEPRACDWCDYPTPVVLEDSTPFEKMLNHMAMDLDNAYDMLIYQAGDNRKISAKFIKLAKARIRSLRDAACECAKSKQGLSIRGD